MSTKTEEFWDKLFPYFSTGAGIWDAEDWESLFAQIEASDTDMMEIVSDDLDDLKEMTLLEAKKKLLMDFVFYNIHEYYSEYLQYLEEEELG